MTDSKLIPVGLIFMRIVLGALVLYFGAQKLFGAFGGLGFSGTVTDWEAKHHFHTAYSSALIFIEFIGGVCVLLGVLTRLAAFGLAFVSGVAAYLRAGDLGLYASASVQDFGFQICLIAMSVMLLTSGAGNFSLDAILAKRMRKSKPA